MPARREHAVRFTVHDTFLSLFDDLTMRDAEAVFTTRDAAGRALGGRLSGYARRSDVLVLAIPRGGIPVAAEVAALLHAPLDVFVVRQPNVPGFSGVTAGAIVTAENELLDRAALERSGLSDDELATLLTEARQDVARRETTYREGRPAQPRTGKTIVLVDDGLAAGSMIAPAVEALRHEGVARIVVAVPLAVPEAVKTLESQADEVVCLRTPDSAYALVPWYDEPPEIGEELIRRLLRERAASIAH